MHVKSLRSRVRSGLRVSPADGGHRGACGYAGVATCGRAPHTLLRVPAAPLASVSRSPEGQRPTVAGRPRHTGRKHADLAQENSLRYGNGLGWLILYVPFGGNKNITKAARGLREKVSRVDAYEVDLGTAAQVNRVACFLSCSRLLPWHPERGPPPLLPLPQGMGPGAPSVL